MRSIAALLLLSTALSLLAPASAEEAAWLAGNIVQVSGTPDGSAASEDE